MLRYVLAGLFPITHRPTLSVLCEKLPIHIKPNNTMDIISLTVFLRFTDWAQR